MHNYCCIRNIYLNLQLIVYVFVELLFNNIRLCVWIAYLMRNVFPFSIYRVVGNLVWFFFWKKIFFPYLHQELGIILIKFIYLSLILFYVWKTFFLCIMWTGWDSILKSQGEQMWKSGEARDRGLSGGLASGQRQVSGSVNERVFI